MRPFASSRPAYRERVLLYSIWLVIAIIGGIGFFWPRDGLKSLPHIPVLLAPELKSWFSEGSLKGVSNQGLQIELKFLDKSLSSLSQVRSVYLGYDLGREKEILFRGAVQWSPQEINANAAKPLADKGMWRSTDNRTQAAVTLPLTLPNPQGTVPKWIRLYFGDSR